MFGYKLIKESELATDEELKKEIRKHSFDFILIGFLVGIWLAVIIVVGVTAVPVDAYTANDMANAMGAVQAPNTNQFFRIITLIPSALFFLGTIACIYLVFSKFKGKIKKNKELTDLL